MVRIGVYNGRTKKRGLTLLNFTVLNDLEYTSVKLRSFNLVGRYNEYSERLIENRIYLVNIKDDPRKPVKNYEILDKCKFIKYVDGEYLITYKRFRNQNLIDLYENRPDEANEFINWVLSHGKKSDRVRLNTFSKTVLEKLFSNYGYDNVIRYDSKTEKKKWNKEITQRVKNFNKKIDDKSTTWSKDEIDYLRLHMDGENKKSEKEIAKHLGRTVPSVATKKWKLKHEYKSKIKDMKDKAKDRAKIISEKLKSFREDQGWSQRKLVEESGISLSVINQLECENYASTSSPTVHKLLDFVDSYDKESNQEIEVEESSTPQQQPDEPKVETPKQGSNEQLTRIEEELRNLSGQITKLNTNIATLMGENARLSTHNKELRREKVIRELSEMLTA